MLRDQYGIIVQPNGVTIDGITYDDGGDSAFSTGLSAFGGSDQDLKLAKLFIKDGKLVRHPYQTINTGTAPHNDPAATSRDQVISFFSFLPTFWAWRLSDEDRDLIEAACLNYAKGWWVNGDFLSPANKLYLYKCTCTKAPLWLRIIGTAWQGLETLWNCYVQPNEEMHKAVVQCYAFGLAWVRFLYKHHPDLEKNIRDYFSGWRARAEIGEGIITEVKIDVNLLIMRG